MSQKRKVFASAAVLIALWTCGVGWCGDTSFRFAAVMPPEEGGSLGSGGVAGVDLHFALFDRPEGGSQIGPTVTRTGVSMTDGAFVVTLDFGVDLDGIQQPYIEIVVETPGSGDRSSDPTRLRIPARSVQWAPRALVGPAVLAGLAAVSVELVPGALPDGTGPHTGEVRAIVDPESFSAAFGVGSAEGPVSADDAAAVSVAAVRELTRLYSEQSHRVRLLEAQIDAVRFRMTLILALTFALGLVLVFTRPGRSPSQPTNQGDPDHRETRESVPE